ncbi:hypothetical protein G6F65_014198 [Rhizopus arrhizus]|nr:hypothetical protein G6F65_014198 [Rhizopus arrhizus]
MTFTHVRYWPKADIVRRPAALIFRQPKHGSLLPSVDDFPTPRSNKRLQLPNELRVVELPLHNLPRNPQRLITPIRTRRVPGKLLVGHVRVVLERPGRLHHIHARSPLTASHLRSQPGALGNRGEVDVVHHHTVAIVGAEARAQQLAHREVSAGAVVERPGDLVTGVMRNGCPFGVLCHQHCPCVSCRIDRPASLGRPVGLAARPHPGNNL